MGEPSDQPSAPSLRRRPDLRLLWYLLLACWVAIVLVGWHTYRQFFPSSYPIAALEPPGRYDRVIEVAGPTSVRLADQGEVRLGGVADPSDAAEADRAAARLRDLLPAATAVYVEREPRPAGEPAPLPAASVYLPPPGAPHDLPFPYTESRLLGALLVQEGLLRVDGVRPYRYLEEFRNLEDDARRHRRGVWASP